PDRFSRISSQAGISHLSRREAMQRAGRQAVPHADRASSERGRRIEAPSECRDRFRRGRLLEELGDGARQFVVAQRRRWRPQRADAEMMHDLLMVPIARARNELPDTGQQRSYRQGGLPFASRG
ncbi:hypothetical protein KXW36_009906, partial [Aspergillus fumigatus]